MKKLLLLALVVGAVVAYLKLFKQTDIKAFERDCRQRVELMFERLKSGNSADEQDALGYWRVGHPEPATVDTLSGFERFLRAKELRTGQVTSVAVIATEVSNPEDQIARSCLVTCRVNDRELHLRMRYREPMEWAD